MTQRKWETVDGWEVLTGWDRPLQHFFVNIDRQCLSCDGKGNVIGDPSADGEGDCTTCSGSGTEYLFNNLSDTQYTDRMGGMTIEQVKQVLDLKLTNYPENITWDLQSDKKNNAGNMTQHYGIWGAAKESGQ